jgi:HSP20 family molecular chaperone IbpA
MKIVQLSEAKPFQFSYCNQSSSSNDCESFSSSSSSSLEWKEDDTCVQLCIEMPGVKAQDIRLAMTQDHFLRVWGRSSSSSKATNKRQRLNVREFPIDTQMVDIERAIASVWKGTLVLYAPKKRDSLLSSQRSSLLKELEAVSTRNSKKVVC